MATAEHFIDELKTLVSRNIEGNTQLAARMNALVQEASRGGLPTNANDLLARWLDFNLASASLMSTHSLTVLNGLLDAAERSLLGRQAREQPMPTHPTGDDGKADTGHPVETVTGPIDVHVEGSPGETVRAPFLVANEYDRALEVAFEASPLGAGGGHAIGVECVRFEPPALSLGKGQRVVQAAIAIPGDAVPGATYRGEIRVKGFHARTIALALTVRPPAGADAGAQGARGASRGGARAGGRSAARKKGAPPKRRRAT